MEGLSKFMREGDIIVNVPEYGANQMGGTEIVWRTFRATASCYNIYRYVDFSKYTNFFRAMSEYNTDPEARYAGTEQTYETKNTSLTPTWCDLAGTRAPHETPNFSSTSVKESSLSDGAITTINNLISQLNELDITFYFSCAPICDGAKASTHSSVENVEKFYQRAIKNLNCPVISNPKDYRFANEEYNNSNYHLCTDAATKRTDQTIADLLGQFEAEGRT